ncbi:hypothetical protein ISCGN_000144 [Ixodes scapularis]
MFHIAYVREHIIAFLQHTTIVAESENVINAPTVVGSKNIPPVLFRGVGYKSASNQALAKGVLRAQNVRHHPKGQKTPPEAYTVMDDVVCSIEVEILKDGQWVPFDADDLQLEFVLIDPFVRTKLVKKGVCAAAAAHAVRALHPIGVPYCLSAFSILFGVFLLSCIFLHHKDAPKTESD